MHHMRLWAAAGIIAVVVVAGFALSVPHTRDLLVKKSEITATTSVSVVKVRDVYRKGVHTLSGSVEAPNACATVVVSGTLEGDASNTARILLAISLPTTGTDICLQVPTTINFQTTVTGPASLPITATVNGVTASTTSS